MSPWWVFQSIVPISSKPETNITFLPLVPPLMSNNYEEKISFLKKQYKEELSHIKNNEESFNCRWQTTWSFDEHFLGLACFLNIKWWIEYEYKHDNLICYTLFQILLLSCSTESLSDKKCSFTFQEVKFMLVKTDKKFCRTHVTNILPSVENFPSDDFVRQKIFKKFTFSNLNNMWKLYENFRKY